MEGDSPSLQLHATAQQGSLESTSPGSLGLWEEEDLSLGEPSHLGLASDASQRRISPSNAQIYDDAAEGHSDWNWALPSEEAVEGGGAPNDGLGGGLSASYPSARGDDVTLDQLWVGAVDEIEAQLWAGDLELGTQLNSEAPNQCAHQDIDLLSAPQCPLTSPQLRSETTHHITSHDHSDVDLFSVQHNADDASKAEDDSRQGGGGPAGQADANSPDCRRAVSPSSPETRHLAPVHFFAPDPSGYHSIWELPSKRRKADSSHADKQALALCLAEVVERIQSTAQASTPVPAQNPTKDPLLRNTSSSSEGWADPPGTTPLQDVTPVQSMLGVEDSTQVCRSYPVSLWWSQRLRRRRALLDSVGLPPGSGSNAAARLRLECTSSADPERSVAFLSEGNRGSSDSEAQESVGRGGRENEAECFTMNATFLPSDFLQLPAHNSLPSGLKQNRPNTAHAHLRHVLGVPQASQYHAQGQLSLSRRNQVSLDPSLFPPPPEAGGLGARVKRQLAALGEAYATGDLMKIRFLSERLGEVASAQGTTGQKLAYHMCAALKNRFHGVPVPSASLESAFGLELQMEVQAVMQANSCWYTFSEIVNTSTLIHALVGKPRVHIILLNEATGLSWPDLFQALAQHQRQDQQQQNKGEEQQGEHRSKQCPANHWDQTLEQKEPRWQQQLRQQRQEQEQPLQQGRAQQAHEAAQRKGRHRHEPIHVRVTALNLRFPQLRHPPPGASAGPSPAQQLQALADACGVHLAYRSVYTPCELFDPDLVEVEAGEAVSFVSSWSLMLFPDESVLKANPRDAMLRWVHSLSPTVFILIEGDANLNSQFFMTRLEEVLARAWAVLEAFDSSCPLGVPGRRAFEHLLVQDIMNNVACEGLQRCARSERLEQWVERVGAMGFVTMPMPDVVWEPISRLSSMSDKLRIVRQGEIARLCWNGTPIVFASAWTAE